MTDVTLDPGPGDEPELEVDQSTEDLEPDTPESEGTDGEDEELEEIELEGKKLQVPKSAKDVLEKAVMRQKDYTQKTMGLAEDRRSFEAERAANESLFEDKVKVRQVQAQIEALDTAINQGHARFQNIDWTALKALPDGDMRLQEAQIELRSLEHSKTQLADYKAKLESEIAAKAKGASAVQQQHVAKLVEQREATLAKEIPGWAKIRTEVEAFAVKHGVTKAELDNTADPRIFKMLRYAKLGMEAEQRGRTAARAEESPPVKPATTLTRPSQGKPAATSRASMNQSPEAWARQRNAELAARNQRPTRR